MTSYDRRPARLRKAKKRRFRGSHRPYCAYCKRELRPSSSRSGLAFTKDHVVPRSLGGKRTVPCCRFCNNLKGDQTPAEWFAFIDNNPRWWANDAAIDLTAKKGTPNG